MRSISLGNPVWTCQYYLLGGGRRIIPIAIIYTSLLVGVYLLFCKLLGREYPIRQISINALKIGAFLQAGLLIVVGAGAIYKALLREYNTRMIESYRTARMGAFTAVLGYVFGATLQVMLLWLIGVCVGALICTAGQAGGLVEWLKGNACLLPCAFCFWSVQGFFGVSDKKPGNVAVIIVIASFVLAGVISEVPYLIGPYLLVGASAGAEAYMLMTKGVGQAPAPAVAVALAMAAFWTAASARRFRRPYLPALDPLAAVGLLLLWCLIGIGTAMVLPEMGQPPGAEERRIGLAFFCGSVLFLAVLPVWMSAPLRRRIICGWSPRYRHESRPPIMYAIISLLIAGLFVEALTGGLGFRPLIAPATGNRWAFAVPPSILIAPGIVFVCALVVWSVYRSGKTSWVPLLVILLWFGVPLMDQARISIAEANRISTGFSVMLTSSPIGTLVASIFSIKAPIVAGLAIQTVLALFAMQMTQRARARFIAQRDTTKCRGCGYSLVGNTTGACPECGRPFTPKDVAMPADLLEHLAHQTDATSKESFADGAHRPT